MYLSRLIYFFAVSLISVTHMSTATTSTLQNGTTPIRLEARINETSGGLSFLSWDTEGTGREKQNLLHEGHFAGARLASDPTVVHAHHVEFTTETDKLSIRIQPAAVPSGGGYELILPFDPEVTPTTIIPSEWRNDGTFILPAIVTAPDFGLARLTSSNESVRGRLEGSREHKYANLILTLPGSSIDYTLKLEPYQLKAPPALPAVSAELWPLARRGWTNVFQPSSKWGPPGRPFSAPSGVLANNVISDPVSFALWSYADTMKWMPELDDKISIAAMVRRTIEYWMDNKTSTTGECIGYWDHYNFFDSNPSLLISSWNYVDATGDEAWLTGRIEGLEKLADFSASRDVDGDGMVEATQTGNRNGLHQPHRSSNWWDAVNCGWKDGFANALIYRGWRCLADLEQRLGRSDKHKRYTELADKLKQSYARTLMNPETGWLGWWRSQDGELHDYATLIVNSMAIEYGLIDRETGKQILRKLRDKITEVGFTRKDLGIPCFLVPVNRSDYLLPDSLGCPKQEDGKDSFEHYMNGGVTAGHAYHWLAAHYIVGEPEVADEWLKAILKHQAEEKFQNGVTDLAPKGIDWTTWDGKPCGYEGYLSDNWRFVPAIMLREDAVRKSAYRLLH